MVLYENGQVFGIFFLQELRFHFGSFLVWLLQWILCAGAGDKKNIILPKGENHVEPRGHIPYFNAPFLLQSAFDDWFVSLYNTVYTAIPIIVIGLLDQVGTKRF